MVTLDWLQVRKAEIKPSANGQSWLLYQGGQFIYAIVALPADGQYTNKIMESNNGNQIQKGKIFPTSHEALDGGLDELREYLGW